MTRCTVIVGLDRKCGLPAVVTFTGTFGEPFGECAGHAVSYLNPVRIERRDIVLGKHRDGTPRTKRHYVAVDASTGAVVTTDSFKNVLTRRMQAAGRRIVR